MSRYLSTVLASWISLIPPSCSQTVLPRDDPDVSSIGYPQPARYASGAVKSALGRRTSRRYWSETKVAICKDGAYTRHASPERAPCVTRRGGHPHPRCWDYKPGTW